MVPVAGICLKIDKLIDIHRAAPHHYKILHPHTPCTEDPAVRDLAEYAGFG